MSIYTSLIFFISTCWWHRHWVIAENFTCKRRTSGAQRACPFVRAAHHQQGWGFWPSIDSASAWTEFFATKITTCATKTVRIKRWLKPTTTTSPRAVGRAHPGSAPGHYLELIWTNSMNMLAVQFGKQDNIKQRKATFIRICKNWLDISAKVCMSRVSEYPKNSLSARAKYAEAQPEGCIQPMCILRMFYPLYMT